MLRASAFGRAASSYDASLARRPLFTKAATAALLGAVGDATVQLNVIAANGKAAAPASERVAPASQRAAENCRHFECIRTARQAAWGAMCAPIAHIEYNLLSRLPVCGALSKTVLSTLISTVCFSPPIHVAYFSWIVFAKHRCSLSWETWNEMTREVSRNLIPALQASVYVWPAATALNVSLVPLPYRVLFVNTVSLGYGMLMSWMANDA